MVEEEPKRDDKSKKKEVKLSHPLVGEVLSKISEIEKKEEKKKEKKEEEKETSQEKFLGEGEFEIPKKVKSSLRKKINFMVKLFSILVVLFFGGWYLMAKRFPLKTWLVDRFSILTHKIIKEKDSVWIKRKIPGVLKEKEFFSLKRKIRKDVKGIPVYVRAGEVKTSSQDSISTLNFTTSDPMDKVATFYLREMEGEGYGLVRADYWPGADIGQLFFSKEGKDCTVSLVENERGGVNVVISYIE
ncbi:hypothetical protein ES706_05001 [subsurface metagenome]|nr:hypothetical protein [Bacillota bacterium]